MCFWSWEYPAAELGLGVDVFSRWYSKADVICVGIMLSSTRHCLFILVLPEMAAKLSVASVQPHHIAAGAAYLAAKILNLDVASYQYIWQEFQTTPAILQDVAQQLMELF
ncbi:hypothetical protein CK203_001298 [Vitis vinifera]|uniref:Uncharacterized protein n=1 Tax=Vitis vinifera TaxID=29760 RepID=A0A438KLP0_VITVI|nr:hypothetical protein CK203_001298 [Vitis vinifera]